LIYTKVETSVSPPSDLGLKADVEADEGQQDVEDGDDKSKDSFLSQHEAFMCPRLTSSRKTLLGQPHPFNTARYWLGACDLTSNPATANRHTFASGRQSAALESYSDLSGFLNCKQSCLCMFRTACGVDLYEIAYACLGSAMLTWRFC
jgi:hypothetical protein